MEKQRHHSFPMPLPKTVPASSTIRVLVADTDLSLFHFTRVVLSIIGVHQVEYVSTGENVIAVAERAAPDLILLDDVPPALDGLWVIQQLRARPSTAQIPIVAYLPLARQTPRARAIIAVCDGHLTKPCSVEDLRAVIQDCVPRYRPRLESQRRK